MDLIIVGIILLAIGLIIRYVFSEEIIRKLGYVLAIIGFVCIVVGIILLAVSLV